MTNVPGSGGEQTPPSFEDIISGGGFGDGERDRLNDLNDAVGTNVGVGDDHQREATPYEAPEERVESWSQKLHDSLFADSLNSVEIDPRQVQEVRQGVEATLNVLISESLDTEVGRQDLTAKLHNSSDPRYAARGDENKWFMERLRGRDSKIGTPYHYNHRFSDFLDPDYAEDPSRIQVDEARVVEVELPLPEGSEPEGTKLSVSKIIPIGSEADISIEDDLRWLGASNKDDARLVADADPAGIIIKKEVPHPDGGILVTSLIIRDMIPRSEDPDRIDVHQLGWVQRSHVRLSAAREVNPTAHRDITVDDVEQLYKPAVAGLSSVLEDVMSDRRWIEGELSSLGRAPL